jgi:hypothetical protein
MDGFIISGVVVVVIFVFGYLERVPKHARHKRIAGRS